jgi:hypothetical protein
MSTKNPSNLRPMNHDDIPGDATHPLPSIVRHTLQPSKHDRRHRDQTHIPYWRGADVTVRPPWATLAAEDSFGGAPSALVTIHADTLTWLFLALRDAFSRELDFLNKLEFYGRLAEAAERHLSANPHESEDDRPLLLAVIAQALQWDAEMRSPGLPVRISTPTGVECSVSVPAACVDGDFQETGAPFDRN